jgi:hypothetical protein
VRAAPSASSVFPQVTLKLTEIRNSKELANVVLSSYVAGDADGKGEERTRELQASAATLGLASEHLIIVDHPCVQQALQFVLLPLSWSSGHLQVLGFPFTHLTTSPTTPPPPTHQLQLAARWNGNRMAA